jgi:serine/threonine-protein kinase HSL1, negative regulator of Swe1 kinase
MGNRSSTRTSVSRKPLEEAPQRLNATTTNVSRQHVDENRNGGGLVKKHHRNSRPRTNTSSVSPSTAQAANPRASACAKAPVVTEAVDRRLSSITQESAEAADSRRVSQFSNISSNASSTRQLKTHIGPWQLGKTLGKGSSARVRLAQHRVTRQLVAVKIVAKSTAHKNQAGSLANLDSIDVRTPSTNADQGLRRMPLAIEREVAILKLIQHPNIIKLFDIWENRSEMQDQPHEAIYASLLTDHTVTS